MKTLLPSLLITLTLPSLLLASVERRGDSFVISSNRYAVSVSATDGSIVSVSQAGKPGSIWKSGEDGLWRVKFLDGSQVSAAAFKAGDAAHSFEAVADAAGNALRMTYKGPELTAIITATGRPDGVELRGEVSPLPPREGGQGGRTLLDFALPARMRFTADSVSRFVCPMNGNSSVGAAFNANFFREQPQDRPSSWRAQPGGGGTGYATLYGGGLDQRPDQDPPVPLSVTDEGKQWLSGGLVTRLAAAQATVNRPPTRAQAELTLVDSPNGPYLSANRLGGTGYLWRVGGGVNDKEAGNSADMVSEVAAKLAAAAPAERTKIGLVSLRNGPVAGGWSQVPVAQWRTKLQALPQVRAGKATFVELTSAAEMLAAAQANDFIVILNPYGEQAPAPEDGGMPATVAAVGKFVRAGGNWFEVGGYPFFYALRPVRYMNYTTPYPTAFADFLHLDGRAGLSSIYRVQPQTEAPWSGAQDKSVIFIPGSLGCGADERGGFADRTFTAYIPAGQTWRAPAVRLTVGTAAPDDLAAYCTANAITRKLADKFSPEALRKFKQSVLVYYAGNARDKTANLARLPVPTLIHFADYLHGGFDKQYPDHLPPHPDFGTPEEFRAFLSSARQMGHLTMPYTNSTWWCDHPKGPTFEANGDAPLLKGLDGKPAYERYAQNDGWTITFWHPAVQAANRKTVRQFTDEYPVDMLFQDQNGARGWSWDTNPASPTPYAYSEGLISQIAEDCKVKPLSTENGWDRVVNSEAQLCGLSWGIVPTEGSPSWVGKMRNEYPPDTWEIYPLAQYIAHDKCSFIHHDLGQFVMNQETLSWTLGLGYGLSYTCGAAALASDGPREWLNWLDRLQKSVCARYIGEPVKAFEHNPGGVSVPGTVLIPSRLEQWMKSTYGPVQVFSNLGQTPLMLSGWLHLAPYGFFAKAPGMRAGCTQNWDGVDAEQPRVTSFVSEGTADRADVWVYGPADSKATVQLPAAGKEERIVTVDGAARQHIELKGDSLTFTLPPRPGKKRIAPPAELAGKAPRDWPGAKPQIGVLDWGNGVGMSWTNITPANWVAALEQSRLAREFGVPVKRIQTVDDLVAALKAGPTAWLGIVNPYGETFPETAPGEWRAMLDMIRGYVNNGGSWWECAGYSFHNAISPVADGWKNEPVGPSGMGYLSLPVGGGEIDQAAEPLKVTAAGREWLGAALATQVEKQQSTVNRGLPHTSEIPYVTLVSGADTGFIGGYRMDGWGWLWRVGGFGPNPDVSVPVAAAALEYIYTHPSVRTTAGTVSYLWHATVTK